VIGLNILTRIKREQNLRKRIALPIVISLALLLGISTALIVRTMRKITHERVLSESLALVQNGALEIECFYTERARIPVTVFQNPMILNWFANYRIFRGPIAGDDAHSGIIRYFNTIIEQDSTIESVFFATDRTQEYFDEDGRYEEEGYFVRDRPWWKDTLQKNRLYCDLGGVDYQDSSRTATLQMPVRDAENRLLGVGGIDISVKIVRKVVRDVHYHDSGEAFLVNSLGQLIYFPNLDTQESWLRELCSLEESFPNTEGLCELSQRMKEGASGYAEVKWQGRKQMAMFAPVQIPQADIQWSLGFFIPEKILYAPIRRITTLSLFISLFIFGAIIGLSAWMTMRSIRPLDLLTSHLDGLVQERIDLTREMSLESMAAVKTTAQKFNTLLSQMRDFLKRVIQNAEYVGVSSSTLREESTEMSNRTRVMSDRAKESTSHAKELLHTVRSLSAGIQEVAHMCTQSNQSVMEGEGILIEQLDQIRAAIEKMGAIHDNLQGLSEKSRNLKEAVTIIDDISEQISLLSINASIEAVKAGDFGKGFSVVAEEIQRMSQNTAEANRRTAELLNGFEAEFSQFLKDMDEIKGTLAREMASFDDLVKRFRQIQDGVALTDRSATRMREEAQRQIDCVQDLNDNIDTIQEAISGLAAHIANSIDKINRVDVQVRELKESTGLFKVG
jgi:methyl-accepting chemotaxis protein